MKLTVNVAGLDNKELLAFGHSIHNAVKDLPEIKTATVPFKVVLDKCDEAINNIYEKTRAKEVSGQIKEIDICRDSCLIGMNKLAEANEYHPDEKVKLSAVRLNQLLDSMGSEMYRQSYDKESVSIKSLLKDLNGDYAADVKTIHGTDYVKALTKFQKQFDEKRQEQLNENVETAEIVSMTTLRKDLVRSIRSILNIVPAFYEINQSPEYKQAISLLHESIQKLR